MDRTTGTEAQPKRVGVKPGDDGYRMAELPSRFAHHEAPVYGAARIHRALSSGAGEAVRHGWERDQVEAWAALDAGKQLPVEPDAALDRLRYTFAALPDDMRCEFAAEVERAAWNYHRADLEHLRIVERREAEAAEHQAQEEAAAQAERDAQLEAKLQELREQASEEQKRAEEEARQAEEEEQRRLEESEELRRQSEALRRDPEAVAP